MLNFVFKCLKLHLKLLNFQNQKKNFPKKVSKNQLKLMGGGGADHLKKGDFDDTERWVH
jgi:hypothetical protein